MRTTLLWRTAWITGAVKPNVGAKATDSIVSAINGNELKLKDNVGLMKEKEELS